MAARYQAPKSNRSFAYPYFFMVKLQPHEATLIQRVYDGIVAESWFNRNAITERELLKLILRNYAADLKDETNLLLTCRDEARDRFSKLR